MSSWAKPGVKCVCINGGSPNSQGFDITGQYPITGVSYTIVETRINRFDGGLLLVFAEINDAGDNYGWAADRFRPLITQEQDVALFKSILTDINVSDRV